MSAFFFCFQNSGQFFNYYFAITKTSTTEYPRVENYFAICIHTYYSIFLHHNVVWTTICVVCVLITWTSQCRPLLCCACHFFRWSLRKEILLECWLSVGHTTSGAILIFQPNIVYKAVYKLLPHSIRERKLACTAKIKLLRISYSYI